MIVFFELFYLFLFFFKGFRFFFCVLKKSMMRVLFDEGYNFGEFLIEDCVDFSCCWIDEDVGKVEVFMCKLNIYLI